MPQADDESRNLMFQWFGDHVSDEGPIGFLISQGYKPTRGGLWEPKEGVTEYEQMTEKEYQCLMFLCDEWDYGGLTTYEHE